MDVNSTRVDAGRLRHGEAGQGSLLLSRNGLLALSTILVTYFWWRTVQRRRFYQGLPGPPHSFLFGHLGPMIWARKNLPPDIHPAVYFARIFDRYNLWDDGLVYIDTYPVVNDSLCIATNPEAFTQFSQPNFERHPFMKSFYGRAIGMKSIAVAEDPEWKEMRKMFNPGFSPANTMTLMPAIIEQGEIFVSLLSETAKNGGYIASLDKMARGVTLDIIFQVVLGLKINTQGNPDGNALANMLEAASNWTILPQSMNPLRKIHVPKFVMLRYYEWRIRTILKAEILERWEMLKNNQATTKLSGNDSRESKLVVDLALKHYRDEKIAGGEEVTTPSNDYLVELADNIKGFIFGGHDTTASTIAWALYELSRNPDILEQVREEHDSVFGTDQSTVPDTLRRTPHLINQLPLTNAVIKETLRLYPPGSGLRLAEPGTTITLSNHPSPLPVTDQLLYISHPILFRSPLFPNRHTFQPSRFLSPPSTTSTDNPTTTTHSSIPTSYRPFSSLPRACIGQDLALLELKTVLLLVCRRFSFQEAYEEMHRRRGVGHGKWGSESVIEEVDEWGGRAYMVAMTSNKPKDGLPVWVKEV